jgi:hypothetical protein
MNRAKPRTRAGRSPTTELGSGAGRVLWGVVSQITPTGSALTRDLILYSLARVALVALLALLLVLMKVPLLVAVLLALVVALPLSLVLFRSLRLRVAVGMSAVRARRTAERDRLRAQLRGERSAG